MSWKPKFYIVYPYSMNDHLQWPEKWGNRCIANIPDMLQGVLNTKAIGSEIKLIWNDWHRATILKGLRISNTELEGYLKANCCMLSFLSKGTRERAAKALRSMGGDGFVQVDSYRDVVLFQNHFYVNKEFPKQ